MAETVGAPEAPSKDDLTWTGNFFALVALGEELGIPGSYLIRALNKAQLERVARSQSYVSRLKAERAGDDPGANEESNR